MKLFRCQACGQILHFENTRCESCGHALGYLSEVGLLSALETAGEPEWKALLRPEQHYMLCTNASHDACNWMVPATSNEPYCLACRHNRIVPDLTVPENLLRWKKLELAKHRLFYTLTRLGLPLVTRKEDPEHGLVFDFLADPPNNSGPKVLTGHDNGLITINIKEADDAERERMRVAMGEAYRTILGHFRHEVGHWFWDVLVRDGAPGMLDAFRELFGDERRDYGEALQTYYKDGPPAGWRERFVTAYASAHPWEDWAESWAHYLHMIDTLETAMACGLRVQPRIARGADQLSADINYDPHTANVDIHKLVGDWVPLTFAVNGLNRSMGQRDIYPFVLSALAVQKLGFIHQAVHAM
jgi:hypothetical protein